MHETIKAVSNECCNRRERVISDLISGHESVARETSKVEGKQQRDRTNEQSMWNPCVST